MALVTADKIAQLLGITPRRIRQLAEQNLIPRAGHGQYDLKEVILALARSKLDRMPKEGEGPPTLTLTRTRLLLAQAEREELDLAKARSQLVPIADYRRQLANACTIIRERLLALGPRLSQELEGKPRADIEVRVNREVREILTNLATPNGNGNGKGHSGAHAGRPPRPRRSHARRSPPAGPAPEPQN